MLPLHQNKNSIDIRFKPTYAILVKMVGLKFKFNKKNKISTNLGLFF
jgi:hypothetical protein